MQLKLFTRNEVRAVQSRSGRRSRKTIQPHSYTPELNLWNEQNESEKEMALLFLDIRNFTPLAEAHEANDVIHIIRKLFSGFQNIIRAYHGRIIETTGDGLYAAFGFKTTVREAANHAVLAARAILKNLETLNERSFEKNLMRRIEAGIGIHTGKVATGNIRLGSEDHMMVMGYAVNIASRLQAATRELNNNLIVSSEVFEVLDHINDDKAIIHNLKGVTNAMKLHLIGEEYN
jgi:adenylate cyclase